MYGLVNEISYTKKSINSRKKNLNEFNFKNKQTK